MVGGASSISKPTMRAGLPRSSLIRREPRSPAFVSISATAWVAVGGYAKPANVNGPRCSAVCPSIATIARAGITTARNCGEKRAFTSACVILVAPPLSWASAQVTCLPTGVAGIVAEVAKPRV